LVAHLFGGCKPFSSTAVPEDASTAVLEDASADAARPFCELQDASFCEDFDLPDGGYRNTFKPLLAAGCSLATDPATSKSPPRSLRVSVPGGANTDGQTAGLFATLGQARHVVHNFEIRIEPYDLTQAGPGVLLETIGVYGAQNGVQMEFWFRISSTGPVYEARTYAPGGAEAVDPLPLPVDALAPGTWHNVDVDLTLDPPAHANVHIDGNLAIDGTFSHATNGAGNTTLTLGIYYPENPTGPWVVHVDSATARLY
jgi:hypothetical protein